MSTISPAVADAFRLLRADLCGRLDAAEFLAGGWDEWTDREIDAIRELIGDLVFLVRTLLREHEVQDTGDCRICTSTWPCRVVTTIHLIVTDPERQIAALTQRTAGDV